MGHIYIFVDQMGLDKMGLDEMGITFTIISSLPKLIIIWSCYIIISVTYSDNFIPQNFCFYFGASVPKRVQDFKNIKNVKRCKDGMPKSMQTILILNIIPNITG